jgi:predicted O-methyltransferase YrrM
MQNNPIRDIIKIILPQPLRSFLSDVEFYLKAVWHYRKLYPESFETWRAIKLLPRWRRSLGHASTPLSRQIPWITFCAIEFLETILDPDMQVFEYGSGGSTLFFARRVKKVVAVEHDPTWADEVARQLHQHRYDHVELLRVPPDDREIDSFDDIANPDAYTSHLVEASFEQYTLTIEEYPDHFFDMIVIDGRARPSCLKHAVPKIRSGGYIVLDDSDREHYQATMREVPGTFRRRDFVGPRLYERAFTKTSVWQRCR